MSPLPSSTSLSFAFFSEHMDAHHIRPGVLKILVQGARNLDSLVTVGEQQPYYILECGAQRSRAKPCLTSGRNPVWNTAHKWVGVL